MRREGCVNQNNTTVGNTRNLYLSYFFFLFIFHHHRRFHTNALTPMRENPFANPKVELNRYYMTDR